MLAQYAANFNELGIRFAPDAFSVDSPLWTGDLVMLTRTGISLPDILCVGTDLENGVCLLSIQVKAWKSRPRPLNNDDGIDHLVKNVSRSHFFRTKNDKESNVLAVFNDHWKKFLKLHPVYHLRIIVNWAGFTNLQLKMVERFNEKELMQPIILAYPKQLNNSLFGPLSSARLNELVIPNPWEMKQVKKKEEKGVMEAFTAAAKMELEPKEIMEEYQ
jgi:hypothetical protein